MNLEKFDVKNCQKRQDVLDYLSKLNERVREYSDNAIINMDETGIHYGNIPNKIVSMKGSKDINPSR